MENKPKQIGDITSKIDWNSAPQNISKASSTSNAVSYPLWLKEIFLKLSHRYGVLWEDKISSASAEAIQKQIFFTALKRFTHDAITWATDMLLAKHQYPDLSFIVKYADEHSQSCKITEYKAIEYKKESTPESHLEAEAARLKIRQLLHIKR